MHARLAAILGGASQVPLSLNFQTGVYRLGAGTYGQVTDIPGWTFSRPGYNAIRNSTPTVGSAVGTPGTAPTNWTITPSEIASSVVGTGTDANAGLPYIDVRFFGTATSARTQVVRFDAINGIASAASVTWTTQARVALVGGNLTNISTVQLVGGVSTNGTTISSTFGIQSFTPTATLTQQTASGATGASTTNVVPYVQVTTGTGAVDITLRIAAPQLEPGTVAGPYQATSGTAVTSGVNTTYAETVNGTLTAFGPNQPRITDKGLLVEESRTNLLMRSQTQTDPVWSATNLTVTDNNSTNPSGATVAGLFNEGTATGVHSLAQSFSATSGQAYTFSVYLKNGTRRYAQLFFGSAGHGTDAFANFDLQTGAIGTVGASATAQIQTLGNGWYRCTVIASATATTASASAQIGMITSTTSIRAENYTGSSATMFVWQTDLAAATFPTSPIVTTTTAATRAADNASVTGLTSILAAPVTMVAWADLPAADGIPRVLVTATDNTGTTNNRVRISRNASNQAQFAATAAGVGQTSITVNGYSGSVTIKSALRTRASAYQGAFNNVATASQSITPPSGLSVVRLGVDADGGSSPLNGYIQQVRILGDTNDQQLSN